MMRISAPNTLLLAAGSTMGMSTVSCERCRPTGLKQTQITVLGPGLFVLLLEPQCKPSLLLQGASWYISAYRGWAAVLFLKPWFKLVGGGGKKKEKTGVFSVSYINQSISSLFFGGEYG